MKITDEDLTTAYMLGVHNERKRQEARNSRSSPSTCWTHDRLGVMRGQNFTLFAGYEDRRIFEIQLPDRSYHVIGCIGEDGSILDDFGNDTGYMFYDVDRCMLWSSNAKDEVSL